MKRGNRLLITLTITDFQKIKSLKAYKLLCLILSVLFCCSVVNKQQIILIFLFVHSISAMFCWHTSITPRKIEYQ